MKNLRFEKLELLSLTEQRARTIYFHPRLTVINGENSVGKSSLLKSLYWAFGASPAVINPRWQRGNVKARVTFTVDSERYSILRSQDRIAIFDAEGTALLATSSITSVLAPFIAGLINFRLVLSNRKGRPEVPPPAYAFLPFYVDQDAGWARPFTSFANLGQYANYKRFLVDYHSGILPNKFYELSATKRTLDIERDDVSRDRGAVQKAIVRLGLEASFSGLELTEEAHEDSTENLLQRLKALRDARQERAAQFTEILDQRTIIEDQIQIVRRAADELAKDVAFVSEHEGKNISCPTCGTVHQNNFSNRFAIIEDREACFEFIANEQERARELAHRAANAKSAMSAADKNISEIQSILSEKRGDVTLRDVIETEGRKAAADIFAEQVRDLDERLGQLSAQILELQDQITGLRNPRRRENIEGHYARKMIEYLKQLNAVDIDYDAAGRITGAVVETGSEHPRALLAYILAFYDTVLNYSSAFIAPLVIDSPVQQEQDNVNAPAIIKLITEGVPPGGQLILGTVSLHGNAIEDGDVITLSDKASLLQKEEFDAVLEKLQPFLDQL